MRFGEGGELDGPASAFHSAPPERRASVDLASEYSVPAYALPGAAVYAYGLRAGVRMKFRAVVTSIRSRFPRIVVKYVATADGSETAPHALPELRTAYLMAIDIAPRD